MANESKDYALLGPPTENGQMVAVINDSEKRIDVGEMRPLPEGKPLNMLSGDAVRLTKRENDPRMDVEYLYKQERKAESALSCSGPPKVTSEAYRDGWDNIWNKSIGQA